MKYCIKHMIKQLILLQLSENKKKEGENNDLEFCPSLKKKLLVIFQGFYWIMGYILSGEMKVMKMNILSLCCQELEITWKKAAPFYLLNLHFQEKLIQEDDIAFQLFVSSRIKGYWLCRYQKIAAENVQIAFLDYHEVKLVSIYGSY